VRFIVYAKSYVLKTPTTSCRGIRKQVLERERAVLDHTTCRILQIAHDISYRVNRA